MTEELEGTTTEPASVEAEAAPEPVQEQATAPDTTEQDDAAYDAMMAEQFGEQEDPAPVEDKKEDRTFEPKDIAPDLHEPSPETDEVQVVPENQIDPDTEYIFKDLDGNEYTVKGSDAIYQTTNYHRKMQQINDELQQYKPLESMFQHEKGRLAAQVLQSADVAERLAAIKDVLKESGLSDVADTISQRMQANNLQHDPLSNQQGILDQQRAELDHQRAQMAAQQALTADTQALESTLGRSLTPRESGGIDNVFGQWMNARQANPNLARPSMDAAYKMAQDAIRFEDGNVRTQKTKTQAPRAERVKQRSSPDPGMPTDDELFAAAMQEQHLTY